MRKINVPGKFIVKVILQTFGDSRKIAYWFKDTPKSPTMFGGEFVGAEKATRFNNTKDTLAAIERVRECDIGHIMHASLISVNAQKV